MELTSYEKHLVVEFVDALNRLSDQGLVVNRLGPVKGNVWDLEVYRGEDRYLVMDGEEELPWSGVEAFSLKLARVG